MKKYSKIAWLLIFTFLFSCSSNLYKDKIGLILGLKHIVVESSSSLNQDSGIRGKGLAIESYKLEVKSVNEFLDSPNKTMAYSERNYCTINWKKVNILDSSYVHVFDLVLNYLSGNTQVDRKCEEIKELLAKPTTFYSFNYKPNLEDPNYVHLFVLDSKAGILYILDSVI
jgi:hypothetical protein